jgi:hypothetical protein
MTPLAQIGPTEQSAPGFNILCMVGKVFKKFREKKMKIAPFFFFHNSFPKLDSFN